MSERMSIECWREYQSNVRENINRMSERTPIECGREHQLNVGENINRMSERISIDCRRDFQSFHSIILKSVDMKRCEPWTRNLDLKKKYVRSRRETSTSDRKDPIYRNIFDRPERISSIEVELC